MTHISFNWFYLAVAVLLLIPPMPLSPELRKYLLNPRKSHRFYVSQLLPIWQNWIDAIRAAAGAYLLTQFAATLSPDAQGGGAPLLVLHAAILAMGVLIQTIRFGEELFVFAPVAYLIGIALVLAGWVYGGFGVFVAMLFAVGGKNAAFLLPVLVVAIGVSVAVLGIDLNAVLTCALLAVPLLIGFLFQKRMLLIVSQRRVADAG